MSRVAVVTGGASGIAGAIGRRLAAHGAPVAIFDRHAAAAETAAAALVSDGGKAIGLTVDVTDRSGIDAALDEVRARLGRPAILVNSAGVTLDRPYLEITTETWNRVLAVNLPGTFDCCQAVLPDMIDAGWGRIVNISSSSVHSGVPGMVCYVTSKSGVVGLTKSLALEFGRYGIMVNTPSTCPARCKRSACEKPHAGSAKGLLRSDYSFTARTRRHYLYACPVSLLDTP